MNLTYFKYLFNRYKNLYLILALVYFVTFTLITTFVTNENSSVLKKLIYFPTTIVMISGYAIPILDFRYYYNSTSVNVYFSLPDRRTNIYRTSYFFHLMTNLLIFCFTIFTGILVLLFKQVELDYTYLFSYMLSMMIIYVITYLTSAFFSSICHTFVDAVIINLAYICLPAVLIFSSFFAFGQKAGFLTWSEISYIGLADYNSKMYIQLAIAPLTEIEIPWTSYIVMGVISLLAYFGTIYNISKFKTEDIGMPTKNILGYKLIIPLYCLLIFIFANYQTGITFIVVLVFVVIGFIVFSLIAKKTFKFDWRILVELLVLLLVANMLVFILS